MGTWSAALFANDLSLDVRREYGALLSIGKSNEETENILFDYYKSILEKENPERPVFWFALAHSEWKKGQLSDFVKETALEYIQSGRELRYWSPEYDPSNSVGNYKKRVKVLKDLETMLCSPMPQARKISPPHVSRCPFEVGSLLAYKICSNEHMKDHSCFGKYALLRVIAVNKRPVTKLVATDFCNESMLVGLYGWIGSEIPVSKIVEELHYIPVSNYTLVPPKNKPNERSLEGLDDKTKADFMQTFDDMLKRRVETCACLDWSPIKGHPKDVLTLLDVDKNFVLTDFFNCSITAYSITHFIPFDVTLSKTLKPYLGK